MIYKNLTKEREEAGLSRHQLGAKTGKSPRTIEGYELGRTMRPRTYEFIKSVIDEAKNIPTESEIEHSRRLVG